MPNENGAGFDIYEDPDLFAEAINFTSAITGFAARLIEKDYFASVLLRHLCSESADLVFKGGTCLSKVYWGFSRLSEDLDFSVAVPLEATRGQRRVAASPMKQAVGAIPTTLRTFRLEEALRGFNVSTQYVSALSYESQIVEEAEKIKVEIGFREPLLLGAVALEARTLLLDPVGGEAMVADLRSTRHGGVGSLRRENASGPYASRAGRARFLRLRLCRSGGIPPAGGRRLRCARPTEAGNTWQ